MFNSNISVSKIHPHPDNPRKDLGDLSELADSIRQRGIMQNLTVIPNDESMEEFIVIIGHRRLAAAKLAGLLEVPCVISEGLSEKEQVAIMLLENMQRSDLTIYEQAQGFQMMMDLGSDVAEIARETGLSKTTVKNRTKLLELDKTSLLEATERGGTLKDYLEVLKIEDPQARNEVLKSVGTRDFEWDIKRAIGRQKEKAEIDKMMEKALIFAIELPEGFDRDLYDSYDTFYTGFNHEIIIPEDSEKTQYYVYRNDFSITLYIEADDDSEIDVEKEKEEAELESRKKALKEIQDLSIKAVEAFLEDITETQLNRHASIISQRFIKILFERSNLNKLCVLKTFGVDTKNLNSWEVKYDDYEFLKNNPTKVMLGFIFGKLLPNYTSFITYNGKYTEEKEAIEFYEMLEKLGYRLATEEEEVIYGTHRLYTKVDDEDDGE